MTAPDYIEWLDPPESHRQWAQSMQFQLARTAQMSPQALGELQQMAIRRLLAHAAATVPFYAERSQYREASQATSLEALADAFEQLPFLERSDIQTHRSGLRARETPEAHGGVVSVRTSGSTGQPIEVAMTQRAGMYWQALTLRDHLWNERDLSQALAVIKYTAGEAPYPGKRTDSWGPAAAPLGTGPAHFLDSGTPVDLQWQWLEASGADYLLTYPSLLRELARINDLADAPLQFRQITTIAENLSKETRDAAEASFEARVCDIYSAQEAGYIALKCPYGDHYHVQSESCLVEVVDDDGRTPRSGLGNIVVTPIHNHAMPLIRYRIGDYAEVTSEACDRFGLPLLKRIVGRERNLVRYPDRAKSWPSYDPMALMDLLAGARFQLRQHDLGRMTLRYVGPDDIDEATRGAVARVIQRAMDHPFEIRVERVEEIARGSGDKYEEFVCEIEDT